MAWYVGASATYPMTFLGIPPKFKAIPVCTLYKFGCAIDKLHEPNSLKSSTILFIHPKHAILAPLGSIAAYCVVGRVEWRPLHSECGLNILKKAADVLLL